MSEVFATEPVVVLALLFGAGAALVLAVVGIAKTLRRKT